MGRVAKGISKFWIRTKDEERKTKNEEQRTINERRRTKDEGRKTKDEGRKTKDERRRTKNMERDKRARNFRNYTVWQEAVDYATKIYQLTATLPYFEKKGLCDQLQRAAVSISSNIAEGAAKPTDADFAHFLDTALGSAYEVETQLTIAHNVGYLSQEQFEMLINSIVNIEKQISLLIKTIRS